MHDLVEAFLIAVAPAEFASRGERPFAIRQILTQYENVLRAAGADADWIRSFVQQAKDRVFHRMHSSVGLPTATRELYQDIFDELSTRSRVSIQKSEEQTFRVHVCVPHIPPHAIENGFSSILDAQKWIDSDVGDTIIRAIITEHEKPQAGDS
jgi:hypothetical protein